ncbi:hypothetical protein J27TS7_18200 [Paenibacillus dendritiformis]|nr:hypothetical protein J27TS7_18200 [Paenibacillus dendritiformis]
MDRVKAGFRPALALPVYNEECGTAWRRRHAAPVRRRAPFRRVEREGRGTPGFQVAMGVEEWRKSEITMKCSA